MLCQGLHIDAINEAFLRKGEEAATPAELCRLAARPRFIMGTGNGCATQGDDNVRIQGLPVTDGWIYPPVLRKRWRCQQRFYLSLLFELGPPYFFDRCSPTDGFTSAERPVECIPPAMLQVGNFMEARQFNRAAPEP